MYFASAAHRSLYGAITIFALNQKSNIRRLYSGAWKIIVSLAQQQWSALQTEQGFDNCSHLPGMVMGPRPLHHSHCSVRTSFKWPRAQPAALNVHSLLLASGTALRCPPPHLSVVFLRSFLLSSCTAFCCFPAQLSAVLLRSFLLSSCIKFI